MKEYVAKDDLLDKLNEPLNWCDDDFELGCAFQYKQDLKCINELPTVTKADICREFYNKAILKFYGTENTFLENCLVEILGEMENEE